MHSDKYITGIEQSTTINMRTQHDAIKLSSSSKHSNVHRQGIYEIPINPNGSESFASSRYAYNGQSCSLLRLRTPASLTRDKVATFPGFI